MADEYQAKGLPLTAISQVLGVSRSQFYKRKLRSKRTPKPTKACSTQQPTDDMIQKALCSLNHRYYSYGYRRLCALFRKEKDWIINHKRMRRILSGMKWFTKRVARNKPTGTERKQAKSVNQVWQMDMTKFFVQGTGWVNVIAVIDAYNREIVGHHISLRARSQEWLEAFYRAVEKRFPNGIRETNPDLTLQVDNGCQPTSRAFVKAIGQCDVDLAFTAIATPEHNAIIERFFRTLKEESIWPNWFYTFEEAVQEIQDYIHFYNSERLHSSLGYLSPLEFLSSSSHLQHSAA